MTNSRFIHVGLFVVAGFASLLWCGCGIVETDVSERGALTVIAWDSTRGEALVGAEISLNSVARQERTPATIGGLSQGRYHIDVTPTDLTYPVTDTTVTVVPPDKMEIMLVTGRSQTPGAMVAQTSIEGAELVLDGRRGYTMSAVVELLAGTHRMSLLHEGYSLPDPGYLEIDIRASDTSEVVLVPMPGDPGIEIGQLAPDLTLQGDVGDTCSVGQFRGCVLLLNFAGFTCDPCLGELPELQRVYEDYYEDGFRVLVINVGWWHEDADDFAALRDNLNLTLPLLFPNAGDHDATVVYDVHAAPTNVLIDRCGIVRARFGATTEEALFQRIKPYL